MTNHTHHLRLNTELFAKLNLRAKDLNISFNTLVNYILEANFDCKLELEYFNTLTVIAQKLNIPRRKIVAWIDNKKLISKINPHNNQQYLTTEQVKTCHLLIEECKLKKQ